MGLATRFDSNADKWRRTTSLPSASTMSWSAWIYISVDQNNFDTWFYRTANSNPPYAYLGTGGDGTTLHLSVGDNASGNISADGSNLSVGVWYFITWTVASNVYTAYVNGVQDAQITVSNGFTPTNDEITFGHDDDADNDFHNGRIAHLKIWDGAALSVAEIQAEMYSAQPVRTANLYGWYPFDEKDHSGLGHDFTASGTPTIEDGPPVGWGGPAIDVATAGSGAGADTGDLAITGSGATVAMAGQAIDSGTVAITGSGGTVAMQGQAIASGAVAITGSGAAVAMAGNTTNPGTLGISPASGAVRLTQSAYPIAVSADKRSFVDIAGRPVRAQTDAFFTLHAHLGQDDITTYLDTLVTLGFSGFRLMHAVHANSGFGASVHEPNDFLNNAPFTTPGHFDTVGAAYAANLSLVITKAMERGLLVFLEALYVGYPDASGQGWETELIDAHNDNTVCFNYGVHLATTYNQPNVVWSYMGDHIISSTALTRFQQIVAGIQSVSRTRLAGAELDNPDTHVTDQSGFTYGTNPATSDMQIDTFYGIGPSANGRTYVTADESWSAGTTLPTMVYEIAYLNNGWNSFEAREEVRMLHHWAVTAGSWAGSNYGDDKRFFALGTGFALDSLSTASTLDKSYANAFYTSFPFWQMRPSGTSTGYAGRTLISSTNTADDDYISSSMTSTGQVLVAYVPHIRATSTVTFTLDLRSMAGTSRARWWNPTTGAYTTNGSADGTYSLANSASAQSFTTPGNNGSSTGDWMLVLDTGGLFAITGSGATLQMLAGSDLTGDLGITGSGGTVAMAGQAIDSGTLDIAASGAAVAMAGTTLLAGSLGIIGSGGTVAASGTSNIAGTLTIAGSGAFVDMRESSYTGADDFLLIV